MNHKTHPSRNPPRDSSLGNSSLVGGVLRVIRDDVVGGTFQFVAADIANVGFPNTLITFSGYLNNVLQATDTLATTTGSDDWITRSAFLLSGIAIDQLQITLDANVNAWEELDNLVLTAAPEPATLALPTAGLLGLAAARRRH